MLLATDFDGTLAPIARTPSEAVLPVETRTLLRRLAVCEGVHLAIISGRALADVRLHVGIENIFFAGNHGLELAGPGVELHHPNASKAHSELEKAVSLLVEKTATLPGVFVEYKGPTAAIHWRLAAEKVREALREIVTDAVATSSRLQLVAGHCVWELRPKGGWNKGDALRHLATRLGCAPGDVLYIGDDTTDEDAFQVVKSGLTFRVGVPAVETVARYRMRDAADVQSFLLCLLGIRSGQSLPKTALAS